MFEVETRRNISVHHLYSYHLIVFLKFEVLPACYFGFVMVMKQFYGTENYDDNHKNQKNCCDDCNGTDVWRGGSWTCNKTKSFFVCYILFFTTFHLTNINWLTKERDG